MKEYQCDICGRPMSHKSKLAGYTLCRKHLHQLRKHGRFLDSIPRAVTDRNDYRISGDIAIFNLYSSACLKVGEFIVDRRDMDRVRYHRWRLSHGRVVTGQGGRVKEIGHVLLGLSPDPEVVIAYRDGDPMNNRRGNLEAIQRAGNSQDQATGFAGVSYDRRRNRYAPELRDGSIRIHLGRYRTLPEAVYALQTAQQLTGRTSGNYDRMAACTAALDDLSKGLIRSRVQSKVERLLAASSKPEVESMA